MTDAQYQQLLRESEAFSELDESLRSRILKADGDERKRYLEILLREKNGKKEGLASLKEDVKAVARDLDQDLEKGRKQLLQEAEEADRTEETNEAENLLDSL